MSCRKLERDAGRAPKGKVRPGHLDVSRPLEGTRDVVTTGGPSAECKDRARCFTYISPWSSQ